MRADKGQYSVFFGVTVAFDTNNAFLLYKLHNWVGIPGKVLTCFTSYIKNVFLISIMTISVHPLPVLCGVPQVSVLRPMLFTLHMLLLGSLLTQCQDISDYVRSNIRFPPNSYHDQWISCKQYYLNIYSSIWKNALKWCPAMMEVKRLPAAILLGKNIPVLKK